MKIIVRYGMCLEHGYENIVCIQDGEKVFNTALMGEHARGVLFTKMI